uniref:Kinesin-like protein n=1 Tax=Takifugu rubripes TaxID=31033 RepID=A0A674P3J4_TAKRU
MSEVNIQVAVRIRPLLPKELLRHHCECVKVIPGSAQVTVNPDRLFTFDHAFGPSASQDEVYRACIQPMVRSLLDGYNATVFCYGETGSGKTYTISGGGQDDEGGIIEHVARDVFGYLDEKLKSNEIDVATVHMSYLELYMEEVRDLLDLPTNQKGLNVRDDINGNTGNYAVNSAEELLSLVEMSSAARQTCTTRMNDKSSRSHTVLTILINQQCNNDSNTLCSSKFCLVDLAGSERVKKTGNTGKHFKESIHINTDLLAVGNVIRALSDRALNFCGKTRKSTFIPFRDAKITRLLRDSLGGTSHTLMMTCVNPSSNSLAETLNVLYFASKARHIRNHPAKQPIHTDPKYNQKLARARISELENEVKLLKEVIEEKQMMIKEVALENIGSEDQRGGDIHFKQGEPLQYWMLTQEAAALLAKISSPSPSFKQELQDWQERLTTINHQHPEDGADFSLSTRVLYQRPGSLRVLRRILAVPRTVLFWREISDLVSAICWSHLLSLGVTAPSVPITTGTTVSFMAHILSISSFSPWYFSGFSCSFFPDVAITWDCYIYHHHCLLVFIHHHYVRLVGHHHLVSLDLEVHRILACLFSSTFGGVSHLVPGTTRPYSVQMFL